MSDCWRRGQETRRHTEGGKGLRVCVHSDTMKDSHWVGSRLAVN